MHATHQTGRYRSSSLSSHSTGERREEGRVGMVKGWMVLCLLIQCVGQRWMHIIGQFQLLVLRLDH